MENTAKTKEENEIRVAEEYLSSLSDLNCNSKPLINMLTMLAEENIEYAPVIVKVVEQHIAKIAPDFKLPILYLIDSIVKNVKSTYVPLFSQCIVNIFCGVFEQVNEKIRERMYSLRQTWNEVFSTQKMYALDIRVKQIDINWPITAKQPQPSIHVNPNFLKSVNSGQSHPPDMEEILHAKTRELLELKKRKLELELEATKKHLEEQEKQLFKNTTNVHSMESIETPLQETDSRQSVPDQILTSNTETMDLASQHQFSTTAANQQSPRNQRSQSHNIGPGSAQGLRSLNNNVKPKVHPVNSVLLNTIRHRDPRLVRKQDLQFQNNRISQVNKNAVKTAENATFVDRPSIYYNQGVDDKLYPSDERLKSGSKSPTRSSTSTQSKLNNSSVNMKSLSEKEKDSKGDDTTNPSLKTGNHDKSKSSISDKDLTEMSKNKSNLQSSSPSKVKDYKRSNKSRSHNRGKNSSNNRSSKSASIKDQNSRARSKISSDNHIKHINKEREEFRSPNESNDLVKSKESIYIYSTIFLRKFLTEFIQESSDLSTSLMYIARTI